MSTTCPISPTRVGSTRAGAAAVPADLAALRRRIAALERRPAALDGATDGSPAPRPWLTAPGQHGPVLWALNRWAGAAGLRCGMRLADARALLAGLVTARADAAADRRGSNGSPSGATASPLAARSTAATAMATAMVTDCCSTSPAAPTSSAARRR